jgi:hypothetical protein
VWCLTVSTNNVACYHQDCDRSEFLLGPGLEILEQNVGALAHTLQLYSSADDIDSLLNA